ncbi:hypothetical protein [Mycobacterium malmoense]|nr:hypothetical protein [Mycobacterium malmoense]
MTEDKRQGSYTIPPNDVLDPEWDKPLTEEQWRAVRWLFDDRTESADDD